MIDPNRPWITEAVLKADAIVNRRSGLCKKMDELSCLCDEWVRKTVEGQVPTTEETNAHEEYQKCWWEYRFLMHPEWKEHNDKLAKEKETT